MPAHQRTRDGLADSPSLSNSRLSRRPIPPAVHCCCGCCRPLARAVSYMCCLVILHTIYTVSQYVTETVTSEQPKEETSTWGAVLAATLLTSRAIDLVASFLGLQAVRSRDVERSKIFYQLYLFSTALKLGHGILYALTTKEVCEVLPQEPKCERVRRGTGIMNAIAALTLYTYLSYIAWSFSQRLEDGSAYMVVLPGRDPGTGALRMLL